MLKQQFDNQYYLNGETYLYVARRLHYKNTLTLLEKLGSGAIGIEKVIQIVESRFKAKGLSVSNRTLVGTKPSLLGTEPNQEIILATCCFPLPQDGEIVGIISERNKHWCQLKPKCLLTKD